MAYWINNIADSKIKKKKIPQSEIEIYRYGYNLLFEKLAAFLLTVFISFLLKAWMEIFLFYIAFVPIRVYLGGYHAKRLINCMFLSSLILIANVIIVRLINISGAGGYIFVLEFVFFIIIHKTLPVETESRKISNSERIYFSNMASVIYFIEIIFEFVLLYFGYSNFISAFVVAHCTNIILVLAGAVVQVHKKSNSKN